MLLTWTDNSANESGFNLQRDTDPAFLSPVPVNLISNGNASLPNTAYGLPIQVTDTSAPAGTVYYRVQAEDDFMPQSPLAAPFQVLPMFSAWVTTQAGAMTTTTISAPAITYGQDGAVTVTVTSAAGTVTGNVTLTVDNGAPITQVLTSGSALFTLTTPAVGNHALVANFAAQNGFAASSATGTLVVNQALASVTPNPASKVYGTADPVFTGTLTGFLAADNVTATYSRTAGETVAGGPYTISATLAPAAVLANYIITYNTAPFTITPVTASVTPNAASKVYGTADPAFSGTLSGFLAADNVTATYSRNAGETVAGSPYTITATLAPAAVLANYTITYGTAPFTITPLAASVTPNAASKAFGTPDPPLTGTLTGFLAADGVTATYTRTPGETVGTYTISATLSPAAVLGNYTITSNTAVFTITSVGPVLALAPTALTFTSTINVTSAAQPFTVRNTGSAALRINSITLGGANPGRFGLTHNCPIGGTGLAAGGSCTVNVTFTPNSNTNRSALVNVNVAAPATSGTVTLTGTTIRPTVSVSPTSLAFGNVPINTTSNPQTVSIQNTGTVPLVISSITMGGANPTRFAQTNNCPIGGTGLAAGASCTASVTFTPNRRVARSATLTIRDNAANSPQTVALTGTGI